MDYQRDEYERRHETPYQLTYRHISRNKGQGQNHENLEKVCACSEIGCDSDPASLVH